MSSSPRPRGASGGFSLVEVTLSLGIAVFCLVVVFGLLTVGINTSSISVEQTNATNLLATIASDLRTAPNTFPKGSAPVNTLVYTLPVPAAVAASAAPTPIPPTSTQYLDMDGHLLATSAYGQVGAPLPFNARYQLNVWFTPGAGRGATIARVLLTWPASATVANASGSVETLVALDRN